MYEVSAWLNRIYQSLRLRIRECFEVLVAIEAVNGVRPQ